MASLSINAGLTRGSVNSPETTPKWPSDAAERNAPSAFAAGSPTFFFNNSSTVEECPFLAAAGTINWLGYDTPDGCQEYAFKFAITRGSLSKVFTTAL